MPSREQENYQGILALLEGTAEELPRVVADLAMVPPEDRPEIMGATRDHSYKTHTHIAEIASHLDDIAHYGGQLLALLRHIHDNRKKEKPNG